MDRAGRAAVIRESVEQAAAALQASPGGAVQRRHRAAVQRRRCWHRGCRWRPLFSLSSCGVMLAQPPPALYYQALMQLGPAAAASGSPRQQQVQVGARLHLRCVCAHPAATHRARKEQARSIHSTAHGGSGPGGDAQHSTQRGALGTWKQHPSGSGGGWGAENWSGGRTRVNVARKSANCRGGPWVSMPVPALEVRRSWRTAPGAGHSTSLLLLGE